jgi:hypothetical protein
MCANGKVREYSDGRAQAENSSAWLKHRARGPRHAGFRALNWPMARGVNQKSMDLGAEISLLHQYGAPLFVIRSIMMHVERAAIASA